MVGYSSGHSDSETKWVAHREAAPKEGWPDGVRESISNPTTGEFHERWLAVPDESINVKAWLRNNERHPPLDRPKFVEELKQEGWLHQQYPELAAGASHPNAPFGLTKLSFARMHFPWRLILPDVELAARRKGVINRNGWDIQFCFGIQGDREFIDLFASHRMTNDRLYRIWDDGSAEFLAANSEVNYGSEESLAEARHFYEKVWNHGLMDKAAYDGMIRLFRKR